VLVVPAVMLVVMMARLWRRSTKCLEKHDIGSWVFPFPSLLLTWRWYG
jgi:hypothetical protein